MIDFGLGRMKLELAMYGENCAEQVSVAWNNLNGVTLRALVHSRDGKAMM